MCACCIGVIIGVSVVYFPVGMLTRLARLEKKFSISRIIFLARREFRESESDVTNSLLFTGESRSTIYESVDGN